MAKFECHPKNNFGANLEIFIKTQNFWHFDISSASELIPKLTKAFSRAFLVVTWGLLIMFVILQLYNNQLTFYDHLTFYQNQF